MFTRDRYGSRRVCFLCFCILAAAGRSAGVQEPSPGASTPAVVRTLIDAGRFQDAESAAERLVAETTAESGTDSLENARAIDLLVEALWRNGRGAQARSRDLAERAVRIKQARLGADDLDLSFSLRNLGNTLLAAGEIRQSLRLFERAVATCERASGPLAIDTANSLDELAGSQRQNELNVEARRTLVRSLNIKETSLGPNDRSVARTLEQLALVDQNLANYRSARSLLERSQRIRVAGNPNDIELDGTVELLAAQSLSEGDAQTARQLYQRALAMRQGHLRADHPQIALDLKRLASATREFGDYHEAKALRERALSIAESNFGPNHPGVAEYVHDLANDNQLLGEYATSRLLYERALKIVRSSRGPDDPAIALYSYNLALLHARLGDQSEARRNLDRAIAIWQRVKGRDHPFVALGLSARARGLAEEGKYAQAQALQEREIGRAHV